jgi:DNA-binding MarR family transcriptional regulator
MAADTPYQKQPGIAGIRASDSVRCGQLEELARACGYAIAQAGAAADILLVDLSSVAEQSTEDWSEIATYLERSDTDAVVWIGVDQLDEAFAALPAMRCHFLVDADDALAVPVLARANRRANMDQLHDRSRDGEYRDLHRMSDELAGFARTLARIAEQEAELPSSLSDKPISFRSAPAAIFEPLVPLAPAAKSPDAAAVRNLIKLRRLREQHFEPTLFADPAWDILLDLYASKLEGKAVSVSSLCIAAAVPPTTALRWITTMTEHGALVRRQDRNDARRVFIELSEDSETRLRAYFSDAATRAGLPI